MDYSVERFKVPEGSHLTLMDMPTKVDPVYESKAAYRGLLKAQVKQLIGLQERFYAADTYSLLLIFQAMDTAGKDGAIRHVMSGVNPQGCQVFSFGHPSGTELDHDFLWRTTLNLPERGRIGIFNRSYYEEVLIVRVHPELLAGQRLPPEVAESPSIWQQRYESIRRHEEHLHRNGTRILKFFLHVSEEEQRRRLLARIESPRKTWKFKLADVNERRYWDHYQSAYADAIGATSTDLAPWYVIPADDKRNARLFVSRAIVETIEALKVDFPELTPEREQELIEGRRQLST